MTTLDAALPEYDDLPRIDELGGRHSWDLFEDHNLGALSLLTPGRRAAACALVREGEVINLSLPLDEPNPPLPGRTHYRHEVFAPSRNSLDDRLDGLFLQGSSQWDGFKHVAAREFGWFGGTKKQDFDGVGSPLGIGHWADHGIVARGVLVDLASLWNERGRPVDATDPQPITCADIDEALARAGTDLRNGDVLLVRTGWLEQLRAADPAEGQRIMTSHSWPGLVADEGMARYLWNHHVCAVVADNRAVEVAPGNPADGYLHRRLIAMLGIPLGELWNLARLATACARLGRYEFLLVSIPLNVRDGVGSPANSIAVF